MADVRDYLAAATDALADLHDELRELVPDFDDECYDEPVPVNQGQVERWRQTIEAALDALKAIPAHRDQTPV